MLKPYSIYRYAISALFLASLALATSTVLAAKGTSEIAALTTVYENEPGNNGGSYFNYCVGNLQSAFMTRRGYLRYDLPDIPEGATITRVKLEMRQRRVRKMGIGSPKTGTLVMRRVTSVWNEGSGGGQSTSCGGGSSTPGVDWDSTPSNKGSISAKAGLSSSDEVNITFDSDIGSDDDGLIADVQAWVDGEVNNGWVMRIQEEATADNARMMEAGTLTVFWTASEPEPDPFKINAGLNDSWFNKETSGQGWLINVFPDVELIFVAWFTFDTERPADEVTAILGEPGHRWLSALGTWEGNKATLEIKMSQGGVFDSGEPKPEEVKNYGTMMIEFNDCKTAILTYDIPSLDLMGMVNIKRVVKDNVALCEILNEME